MLAVAQQWQLLKRHGQGLDKQCLEIVFNTIILSPSPMLFRPVRLD